MTEDGPASEQREPGEEESKMTAEQHQDEADTAMDVTVIPAESAVAASEPEAPAELPD